MKNKVLTRILIVLNFLNLLWILMFVLYKSNLIFKHFDSCELIILVITLSIIIFEFYCFIFLLDNLLSNNLYNKTFLNLIILCSVYFMIFICLLVLMLKFCYPSIMVPIIVLSPVICISIILIIQLFKKKHISRFSMYLYVLTLLVYMFTIAIFISYAITTWGIA